MLFRVAKALAGALVDTFLDGNVLYTVTNTLVKERIRQPKSMGYERKPEFKFFPNQFYYDIPVIKKPVQVEYKVELHEAKRAGTHLDFRFKYKGRVYDFAVVKSTKFPESTGIVQRVVRRHNHSIHYFETDSHEFPVGSYGEGKMQTIVRGNMDIIYADPTKIEFIIDEGQFKGRYCIFTEKSEVLNDAAGIIRMKDPEPFFKERRSFDTNPNKVGDDYIAEWKVDGANFIVKPGEKLGHNQLVSRRLSVDGTPIERSAQTPQLRYFDFGTKRVLHGELAASTFAGPKPHNVTSGILNSGVMRSRFLQRQTPLVYHIWDIEGDEEYLTRREIAKQIARRSPKIDNRNFGDKTDHFFFKRQSNPNLILMCASNVDIKDGNGHMSVKDFTELVKVAGGEGVVLKDPKGLYYEGAWIKDKNSSRFDAVITGFQEGQNKYTDSLGALTVVTPEGYKGTIGTGFTDIERMEIWRNQDKWVGRSIEVECHEITDNGVMRGPRAVDVKQF